MNKVTLNSSEWERMNILQQAISKQITKEEAALHLGCSLRHAKRLCKRLREAQGNPASLAHGNRGRKSSRRVSEALRNQILDLYKKKYYDFGPTLLSEHLELNEGIVLSREWLRKFLSEHNLRPVKKRRRKEVFQQRNRRSYEGELVQIDGSYHEWFEERGEKCCLLVFIDDATGKLLELRFTEHESIESYFEASHHYFLRHGLPLAFYSDRLSVFKTSRKNGQVYEDTQFQRAMKELDIKLIHANTPQAKGRVERANKTLQDRLIKEMRLKGISSIEEGNLFLKEFMVSYNQRFGRPAKKQKNMHQRVTKDLSKILLEKHTRTVLKDCSIQFNRTTYLLDKKSYRLIGKKVKIFQSVDGCIRIECNGQELHYKLLNADTAGNPEMNRKQLNAFLDKRSPMTAIQRKRRGIYFPN